MDTPAALPLDLAAIALLRAPLHQVPIAANVLRLIGHPGTLPTSPDWAVAASPDHRVVFTQLISTSAAMRDGAYEYLLLIDGRPIIIAFQLGAPDTPGHAWILPTGAWRAFPLPLLQALADRAAIISTNDRQPFVWRPSPGQ